MRMEEKHAEFLRLKEEKDQKKQISQLDAFSLKKEITKKKLDSHRKSDDGEERKRDDVNLSPLLDNKEDIDFDNDHMQKMKTLPSGKISAPNLVFQPKPNPLAGLFSTVKPSNDTPSIATAKTMTPSIAVLKVKDNDFGPQDKGLTKSEEKK